MASLAELLAAKKKQTTPAPEIKIDTFQDNVLITGTKEQTESFIKEIINPIPSDCSQEVADILLKIRSLNEMSDLDLKGAMDSLKLSLLENPAAVEIMLPEDIGEMVKALMKITGQQITEAVSKKKAGRKGKEPSLKNLSEDDISKAFEEL